MQIKKFNEPWTNEEIKKYIDTFNVLVLFEVYSAIKEAQIIIHGKNLIDKQKKQLKEFITMLFGGEFITDKLCIRINRFAEKWYNKIILKKHARVINFKKRKK